MTRTFVVSLGRHSTGLNLSGQFIGEDGSPIGDAAVLTSIGNGRYRLATEIPGQRCWLVVRDTDRNTVVQVGAVQAVGATRFPAAHRTHVWRNGPITYVGGT
jgi:hypothetical protein